MWIGIQLGMHGHSGTEPLPPRCMVWPDRPADIKPQAVELLADVVDLVHAG